MGLGGTMDSVASKLNLMEVGTRYSHYMELKEVFLLGIDVIDRMNQSFVNNSDKKLKEDLQTSVSCIEKRLAYLVNYSMEASQYSDFGREIDRIQPHRTPLLTAGSSNDTSQNPPQDSNPRRPEEDSGGETANA
jgi:hypothetical protein